jgi:hypothetical protein
MGKYYLRLSTCSSAGELRLNPRSRNPLTAKIKKPSTPGGGSDSTYLARARQTLIVSRHGRNRTELQRSLMGNGVRLLRPIACSCLSQTGNLWNTSQEACEEDSEAFNTHFLFSLGAVACRELEEDILYRYCLPWCCNFAPRPAPLSASSPLFAVLSAHLVVVSLYLLKLAALSCLW